MKKLCLLIVSLIYISLNIISAQDIINETGKDGKFIVRDNDEKELLVIDEGDVSITGALKVDKLQDGSTADKVVVWSEEDKKFKALNNMIPAKTPINASILAADSWTEDGSGNIYRATGMVGIGTTTPQRILDINPSVSGSAQLMRESDSDLFAINLKSLTNRGEILLYKNGAPTTKLTGQGITYFNSGNVGIGTTNPLSKLSVGGDGNSSTTIYSETSGGFGVYSKATYGQGVHGIASGGGGRGVVGMSTYNGVGGPSYGGYFKAEADVSYGIYGEGGEYGVHGIASGSTGSGVYGHATNSSSPPNFGGYFRADGSLGIGVYGKVNGTDAVGVYGEAANFLDVENYGGYFRAAGNSGRGVYGEASKTGFLTNYGGYFKAAGDFGRGVYGSASGSSGRGVFGYASGSSGEGVRGYGTAYDFYAAGPGTNYGSSSSIRWKRDIVEIDNPLDKISEIRGVYFNWDEEHGGGHDVGMIAEEVGKVLPEIVVYEENGIDADGMDYSKLTPLLVEAVKALTKRVEELESRK